MKTKQQIIEDMKKIGYEEISQEEYMGSCNTNNYISIHFANTILFFKPIEQEQDVFEDDERKITITDSGGFNIIDLENNNEILFSKGVSFPILVKAVERAKKKWGIK